MRLIDADALESYLAGFCKDCNSYSGAKCRACDIGTALDAIEDADTVEYVPVVRCQECSNWRKAEHSTDFAGCKKGNPNANGGRYYCSDGKKKS